MKIKLVTVGKTTTPYILEGIDVYLKRLVRYFPFEMVTIPDLKNAKNLTEALQKQREGEAILKAIEGSGWVVLLDERGKEFTSREFATYISNKTGTLRGDIVFVVGGPYGFSDEVYARANDKLSFSRMTFSHEMIRLFFVEQLYRAFTILNNEPYHHD